VPFHTYLNSTLNTSRQQGAAHDFIVIRRRGDHPLPARPGLVEATARSLWYMISESVRTDGGLKGERLSGRLVGDRGRDGIVRLCVDGARSQIHCKEARSCRQGMATRMHPLAAGLAMRQVR